MPSSETFDLGDIACCLYGTTLHEQLDSLYKPVLDDFILEAGCGVGKLGIHYAYRGVNVVLLDVDVNQIRRSQKLLAVFEAIVGYRLPVSYRIVDARNLPYENDRFDLVFSEGVAEHWVGEERLKYLKEMVRVSRDCVAVAVPDAEDPESQRRATTTKFQYSTMPPEEHPMTELELRGNLHAAGLGSVKVKKFKITDKAGFLLGVGFKR